MIDNRYPSLDDKVVIVTGISRGIGRAIAEAFVAAGSTVFGSSRTDPALPGATWVEADMSQPGAGPELVARAVKDAGGIDIVVNSVGGLAEPVDPREQRKHQLGSSMDLPDEVWQTTMDINLYAAVRTIRAAMPHLLERRGSIVNISTVAAVQPDPSMIDYAAAKAALNAFTKGIATEFGPRGVRANIVSSGAFLTPGWTADGGLFEVISQKAGIPRDKVLDHLVKGPEGIVHGAPVLGRFGEVAEIASTVLFLASDGASYITGADIRVDGGMTRSIST
jgi:NAD(P)-dependent dehydrogenase (short-subunit alcohol dehydrogenase family)